MSDDLAEFLLARIEADEHWARILIEDDPSDTSTFGPRRVLAEAEAKRRIVEEQHHNVNDGDCGTCVRGQWGYPTHGGSLPESWPCLTLRLLASAYASHPDFDERWAA